jgi:hypothetical protein
MWNSSQETNSVESTNQSIFRCPKSKTLTVFVRVQMGENPISLIRRLIKVFLHLNLNPIFQFLLTHKFIPVSIYPEENII